MKSRVLNPYILTPLLVMLALTGCSAKPDQASAAKTRIERGAPAPAAPIALEFQVPERAPAGQALSLDIGIKTPVKTGSLEIKVARQHGVTLLADPFERFDLGSTEQPLPVKLELLPGGEHQRYVVLVVTIETDSAVPLARSFRIALPDGDDDVRENPAPAPKGDGLKILPSSPAR